MYNQNDEVTVKYLNASPIFQQLIMHNIFKTVLFLVGCATVFKLDITFRSYESNGKL